MPRWEYSVITINTEYEVPFDGKITDSPESNVIIQAHLNEMGADGWELVASCQLFRWRRSGKA